MKDKKITFNIFTDGSSLIKGKYYESSSSVVIYHGDTKLIECGKYHKNGTISLGEAYAVMLGLDTFYFEIFDLIKKEYDVTVRLFSDSDYVVRTLTEWMPGWIRKYGINGTWLTSKNEPVAHSWIFKHINSHYYFSEPFKLEVYHVNSHTDGKKLSKVLDKFNKRNKTSISKKDFEFIISGNDKADKIADELRVQKILELHKTTKEFERGDMQWMLSTKSKNLERRNGRVVIKRRNLTK